MKYIIALGLIIASVATQPVVALSQTDRQAINNNWRSFSPGGACGVGSTLVNSSLDRFLQVLAFNESGGKVDAQNPNPGQTASGKYQYVDGTWRSRASLYPPAGAYAKAKLAPEEIQDAVAYIEYAKLYQDHDGDVRQLFINHYLPSYVGRESEWDFIPSREAGNTLTLREYANKGLERINEGVGKDIPLKYREAPEFDFYLAERGVTDEGTADSISQVVGSTGDCSGTGALAGSIQAVVEIALNELGNKESPMGSDCGDEIRKYFTEVGHNCGQPWCATFTQYVFKKAGLALGTTSANAQAVGRWFKDDKFFFTADEPYKPQPGDVYVKKRNNSNTDGHIGIVVEVNGSAIVTVDGNLSGTVKKRSFSDYRAIPELVGFGRYAEPSDVQALEDYDPSSDIPDSIDLVDDTEI